MERTLTFNMEDALLSPESFAVLSGAGLVEAGDGTEGKGNPIYVHQTSKAVVKADKTVVLEGIEVATNHANAQVFCMALKDGEVDGEPALLDDSLINVTGGNTTINVHTHGEKCTIPNEGEVVLLDYYVKKTSGALMLEITPDKFGGYYYVEASTLYRRESDGVDMPAEFIIPKAKVQSNFTIAMASTGDPSTFSFVMDAMPDYTKFDATKKVLAAIQVVYDEAGEAEQDRTACPVGNA